MLSYSGLSKGFWGEAILTACYVINRVSNKGTRLTHMSFESRDTIFDENRFSSIPRPKVVVQNLEESQREDHSDNIPSEILEPRKEYPRTYNEAMQSSDITFWKKAIHDEIGPFMGSDWALSDLPPGCKLLGIDKFKARLESKALDEKKDKFDNSGKGVIICLYVDDMLIFGTDQNQVDKTKKFLSLRFSMKDMGVADVILGIKIKQKLKPNTGKPVDKLEYSRAIGCLMYAMASTRPDIAYAVGRLSKFTSNPSRQHWKVITRIFKYLRGTKDYGLSYVGYPLVLEGYSDASWINHIEDSSFMSGWLFLLRGCVISWASKKQTCITSSTMESKFVALTAPGKEAEWLRNLINEIPIWPEPINPISI
nr:zinc finger, CCHC-type [Tanacetum cinerariifolium]